MSYKHRDSTSSDGRRGDFSAEVKKLIKCQRGEDDREILGRLRARYGSDSKMVSDIFAAYKEKKDEIVNKVRKFERKIYEKYGFQGYAPSKLIKKAMKHAKKLGLNDSESEMFVNFFLSGKHNVSNTHNLPNTRMSRVLGYSPTTQSFDRMNVDAGDVGTVQEILKINAEKKALHNQVVIQCMEYQDCAPQAITGEFNPKSHNAYSYVHPIIAALFLPKINYLDSHLLLASIGNIVKRKYEGLPVETQPDYELLWDLVVDPNDAVCDMHNVVSDLKNRTQLQTRLWESVLHLRQGQYYKENLTDFLVSLDNCNTSVFDAPDQAFVKDEISMVRKLFSCFSLRPTIVSTTPLYGLVSNAANYLNPQSVTQVTTIPMVNLRLPLNYHTPGGALNLKESLEQAQWFVENKMIVPKTQNILHSRDILVFAAHRRFHHLNIKKLTAPYEFTKLPQTASSFQKVNDRMINFDYNMTVSNSNYKLRSVVLVEKDKLHRELIVGATAAIVCCSPSSMEDTYLLYDPQGASIKFVDRGAPVQNPPITTLSKEDTIDASAPESFYRRCSTRGTVFIYAKTD